MNVPIDHSHLLLTELHKLGIRSTKWLEEALEDTHSAVHEITLSKDPNPIFFKVGFCSDTIAILYIFEFTDKIISRQARKANINEITKFWCK